MAKAKITLPYAAHVFHFWSLQEAAYWRWWGNALYADCVMHEFDKWAKVKRRTA
jgi:hypothetical protein